MWWFGKKHYHLPEATGQFEPGCMDVMLDYNKEGIFMRLYYPTDAKKGDPNNSSRWCSWIPDDSYFLGIAKVLLLYPFFIRLAMWWSSVGIVPAMYGAKAKVGQKLKCIILSHGLGGHRSLYSNLCCELASRGYLVAALEHRDHSGCYTYYYKSKEDAENRKRTEIQYEVFQEGKQHFEQRQRQVNYRAEECSKAVDFLINLNKGKVAHNVIQDVPTRKKIEFKLEDLVKNLNLDSLTMMGHSFGGATALLSLSKRHEFKQGILLDPWMFPIKNDKLEEKLKQPLLFINTQTFHITSNVQAMGKFLTSENAQRTMYTLLHTTHENQTDTVLLIGYWLNWFMKKLDPVLALKINNALILNFLDKYGQSPSDIEDMKRVLEEEKCNYESGLTKPWA